MSNIVKKEADDIFQKTENNNATDKMADLSVSYAKLIGEMVPSIQSTVDSINKAYLEIVKNLFNYFQSDAWKAFNESVFRMVKSIAEASFSISGKLLESLQPIHALVILEESKWPYFMFLDENKYEIIIDCENRANTQEELELHVSQVVFEECNDCFIKNILEQWCAKKYVIPERELLIRQAIECYENELYAASTALLLTQVNWIINDTSEYMDNNQIDRNEDKIRDYIECAKVKLKKGGEKEKLVEILSTIDIGYYRMSLFVDYINNTAYTSKDNYCHNQPCRNKIMHGIQYDFNTKEHALKTILIFDSLIRMRDYVESLSNNRL